MSRILEKWNQKIQKNAFKSALTYTDKDGVPHTEEVFFKRSNLPLIGDWARIYPPVDENGKVNKLNLWFGGKKNLIKTLIILAIVAMVLFQFYENFNLISQLKETCTPLLNLN